MAHNEKKINITMVAPANNPHTHRFAELFLRSGNSLKIVSYVAGDIENAEIYVHSQIPEDVKGLKRKWEFFKDYKEVRKILEWADIVFVNYIYNWRFNEVYRGLNNIVVLLWGSDITYQENETKQQVKYKKLILSIASRVLSFSNFLAQKAEKYMPEGKKVEIIPGGVKLDEFYPGQKSSTDDNTIIIGYAKGLYSKYGPDVLIKACDYLRNEGVDFICRIAGGGDQEVELKILVDRLDLKNHVEFLGRRHHESMPDFMRELDIFVMPSVVEESYGIAALEASATGIPVVASNTGGIPEVVWMDETGLLVDPGNPADLAMAIKSLIINADLRSCMGRQGRDFVRTNYSWDKTVDSLDDIFTEVLKETNRL
ncbi:MAG: glycosyltransferase family 4 protein [bacterium]